MFNIFETDTISNLGALASITVILVQLIKDLIPKKIPTKLITIIVSILISIGQSFYDDGISIVAGIKGFLFGCITAFVAMNGFDSIRDIVQRFQISGDEDGE